jgi:hypothetical protein
MVLISAFAYDAVYKLKIIFLWAQTKFIGKHVVFSNLEQIKRIRSLGILDVGRLWLLWRVKER